MSSLRSRITLSVGGMTCENCRKKIVSALRAARGVLSAEVSFRYGTATVVYDADRITEEEIIRIIEKKGYRAQRVAAKPPLTRTAALLAVILVLYFLIQRFGLLNTLVPSQLADTGMSAAALFLIGLLTSVHCVAMCGGIHLSQCLPRGDRPAQSGTLAAVKPALAYHLGRVISYTVMGGLLGLLGMVMGGGSLAVSPLLQGILKLLAGVAMVVMGVNMLGLLPWLRRFRLHLPDFLAERIGREKTAGRGPLIVGLLNGLMPCGPLQAMQIVALASGNPASGALSMLAFSLGTVPLMLGLGSLAAVLGQRFARQVMGAGAVLVAVLGLAMAAQGVGLAGIATMRVLGVFFVLLAVLAFISVLPFRSGKRKGAALAAAAVFAIGVMGMGMMRDSMVAGSGTVGRAQRENAATAENGVQVVRSTLSARQYPSITVQEGVPVRWIIDAPAGSVNGCNYRMMLSPFGQEVKLHEGENIVEFTPERSGSYDYSCWMGMVYGSVTVTGADGSVPEGTVSAAPSAAQGSCPMCAGSALSPAG